jgi:excisionase family DNA binding protein
MVGGRISRAAANARTANDPTKARIVEMDDTLLTVEEIAQLLRVSTKTVYRLLRRGEIPAHRIGHHWRFDRSEVTRWIFNQRVERVREEG